MKTYLYATYSDEGIIELVRKNEHDAVVRELNERLTQQQADMLDTIVQRQLELTSWKTMAERLATALDNLSHDCTNHSKDIQNIRWGHDGDCGANLSAEQIEECCDAVNPALAAYESAKKGEFPDPLAEAVKRMESVPLAELSDIYNELWADHHSAMCKKPLPLDAVRACLIQAAKGEQP